MSHPELTLSADRFDVFISDEGTAVIDGEALFPDAGRSVHEAVLDLLQRRAAERGRAVEATVNDRPGTEHFVLEVAPDGSSRIVTRPDSGYEDPGYEDPDAHHDSSDVTDVSESLTDVPESLADRVQRINVSLAEGRLDEAFVLATALRERLTHTEGAEHPHALEARAMEAYVAYLRGDHRQATVLALAVARIRCRDRDSRAAEDVARAAAAWRLLDDDLAAVAHGRELLHMWDRLEHQGLLDSTHAELARVVRCHLDGLEAAAVA